MRFWRNGAVLLGCTLVAAVCSAWDWDVLQRLALQRFGPTSVPALKDWRTLMQSSKTDAVAERLGRVNAFFNQRIRFVDDVQAWGKPDYWATPLESLSRGEGDCEDFAIAKYLSLLELGVPEHELRLVYVKARIGGAQSTLTQAHMVLTWFAAPDADPIVLDNLIGELRPASRRPDLTPVFSFNSQGIYAGNAASGGADINRLSRWRDLLDRARNEGLLRPPERKTP